MTATPGGIKKNPILPISKFDKLFTQANLTQPSWRNNASNSMPIMLDGSGMCVSFTISSPRAKQPNIIQHCRIITINLGLQNYK